MNDPVCFLAQFAPHVPCSGRLVRVHLLPRQLLKRECPGIADGVINNPASWVWGCGGPMGNAGHHGMLDARGCAPLRIPLEAIPPETRRLADRLGLDWWVVQEYGGLRWVNL